MSGDGGVRNFRIAGSVRVWAALLLVAILAGVLWAAAFYRTQHVAFPDGVSLQWLGVTVGTNAFIEGSPLEKILGDRIPMRGMRIGGFDIRRPRKIHVAHGTALTAWILLKHRGLQPAQFGYYWQGSGITVSNASGRVLQNPPARPYRITTNEVLLSVPLHAFPRDQRKLHLQIGMPVEPFPENPWVQPGRKRRWAEFRFNNPLLELPAQWTPSKLPVTNEIEDLTVVLTGVQTDPTEVRFLVSPKEWTMTECRIGDEEGNGFSWARMSHPEANARSVEFDYALETNRTWKVHATLIRAAGFPFSKNVQFPVEEQRLVQIALNGPEVHLTNTVGVEFACRFTSRELLIRGLEGPDRPYFVLLGATNEHNQSVQFEMGGWTGTPDGIKAERWATRDPASNLTLHLACPAVVKTEFYVRPAAD